MGKIGEHMNDIISRRPKLARRATPRPCAHCRAIRDMLKVTMDTKREDSIMVMFSADAIDRIYANAKKGAR